MVKVKIKNFFNSFRNKVLIIAALVLVVAVLLITKLFLQKDETGSSNNFFSTENTEKTGPKSFEELRGSLDGNIDSILAAFGIKKDWITTLYNTTDKSAGKNTTKDAEWFTKSVLIPKELSSIEVNVDLSGYLNSVGLSSSTNEDIITKDISLTVKNPDTTKSKLPLAKIDVVHSDKVTRETALFCFIVEGVADYSPEELDKLLMNKNEFSFLFPRNLDEIDIQNKLLHHKKDVMVNLTVGGKENYETDFNTDLDEKAIRDRVKSFSIDYPSVSSILLTKSEPEIPQTTVNKIAEEFGKYKIKVVGDSALTRLVTTAEEESKEKYTAMFTNLRTKANLVKNIVTLVKVTPEEFEKFYNDVIMLKKQGYKFCSYSEYYAKSLELEKQLQEKETKRKEEEKIIADKKAADKKQQQLEQKKKQQEQKKKSTDKKTTDKKKTDTKTDTKKSDNNKKTDVKKKTK